VRYMEEEWFAMDERYVCLTSSMTATIRARYTDTHAGRGDAGRGAHQARVARRGPCGPTRAHSSL